MQNRFFKMAFVNFLKAISASKFNGFRVAFRDFFAPLRFGSMSKFMSSSQLGNYWIITTLFLWLLEIGSCCLDCPSSAL